MDCKDGLQSRTAIPTSTELHRPRTAVFAMTVGLKLARNSESTLGRTNRNACLAKRPLAERQRSPEAN